MTTLNITNVSSNFFTKNTYTIEELAEILFNKLDFNVEIDSFSEEENQILLKNSSGLHKNISNLLD